MLRWDESKDKVLNIQANLATYLASPDTKEIYREKALQIFSRINEIKKIEEEISSILDVFITTDEERKHLASLSSDKRKEYQANKTKRIKEAPDLIVDKKAEWSSARDVLFEYLESDEIQDLIKDDNSLFAALVKKANEKPSVTAAASAHPRPLQEPEEVIEQMVIAKPNLNKNAVDKPPVLKSKPAEVEIENFSLDDDDLEKAEEVPHVTLYSVKGDKEHITEQAGKTPLENFKTNLNRYLNKYAPKRFTNSDHHHFASDLFQKIGELEQIDDKSSLKYYMAFKEFVEKVSAIKIKERGKLGRSFLFKLIEHSKPLLQAELLKKSTAIESAIAFSDKMTHVAQEKEVIEVELIAAKILLDQQTQISEDLTEKLDLQKKLVGSYQKQLEEQLLSADQAKTALEAELAQEKLKSNVLRNAYNYLAKAFNQLLILFGKEPLDLKIEKSDNKQAIEQKIRTAVNTANTLKDQHATSEKRHGSTSPTLFKK